ncbi:hypothetical protein D3C80_1242940 [compost metagenome]
MFQRITVGRLRIALTIRQLQYRFVVLIQQGDGDRQVAGSHEVFQTYSLLNAQQRFQLGANIDWRQYIQIADIRPLLAWADPIQVIVFILVLGVAIFKDALMQRFQRI